jgi:putative addiction module CopG family antidote
MRNHMSYSFPSDVKEMVQSRLASGRYSSEDDVLRDALRALSNEEDDVAAVREAIDEWRAGDEGIPLADAFDEVRERSAQAQRSE